MSHNTNKINAQKPDSAGSFALALTQLGSATFNNQQYLGIDASGDPKGVAPSNTTLDFIYSCNITSNSYWQYSVSFSVGDRLEWRRASATTEVEDNTYLDVTYAGYPTSYATWGNQFNLSAGDYLFHLAFPITGSSSNAISVRLYNETNSTWVGAAMQLGEGRQANSLFTRVSLSASKTYSYRCSAVTGTWSIPNYIQHQGISIWIIRL
jgi:hypothetical protein